MRGAYDLPKSMKTVYIQGGSSIFREQFSAMLKSSSGQLVDSPDKAEVILNIYKDGVERRVLSLSERGRSNDIELAGHIEYDLRDAQNNIVVPKEPVDFRKEYFNDQQDVMAKDNEETVIRKEMYQQVVRTIINRGRAAFETMVK
ncbi:MAG: hypothetical protein IPN42_12190 [Methylococcaceae bacterium]|nr:hypothetical protein [Methylococcaceae bacterium]